MIRFLKALPFLICFLIIVQFFFGSYPQKELQDVEGLQFQKVCNLDFDFYVKHGVIKIDCENPTFFVSPTRVDHGPKQVKSGDELRIGRVYHMIGVEHDYIIKIVRPLYRDELGFRFGYWVMNWPGVEPYYQEAYLSDYGIVPYESGYWNATNYILR